MYIRLSKGLNDYKLIPEADVQEMGLDRERDWYTSIFKYNEDQYNHWKTTKSVSGIRDVVTDKLVFDFDNKEQPKAAQADAIALTDRLISKGIDPDAIQIAFSGSKGFSIEIPITEHITQEQFKTVTSSLADGLETFDRVIFDPQRIFRVTGTKHNKSGLYKTPITLNQLREYPIDEIKELASTLFTTNNFDTSNYKTITLNDEIKKLAIPKKKIAALGSIENVLDMSNKPRWLTKAKYALQEGYFSEGQRSNSFMVLASTYKNQGFSKEIVYRMLKGVAEKQAVRNKAERFEDEQIWNNIIGQVFSPTWNNGQYAADDIFLKAKEEELGLGEDTETPRIITDINNRFKNYVNNIEKNTIKTGIEKLDEAMFISVGSNVALLGAPGSGKSSIALEILSNTSKNGVKSVFASLDMTSTRIYEKILYRLSGMSREELYEEFKQGREKELVEKVDKEFGNVFFFDKSSPRTSDLRNYVLDCEQKSGDKVKLVMIDYFERISSDMSDDTAASKRVAGELQDLVNDLNICLITLVQPNKMSGDMSQPIHSYTNIKGSSFLAQSFRQILSIHREGYDPMHMGNDKFLTVNILKNDLGEPGSIDFGWQGKQGKIFNLDREGEKELKRLRDQKNAVPSDETGFGR